MNTACKATYKRHNAFKKPRLVASQEGKASLSFKKSYVFSSKILYLHYPMGKPPNTCPHAHSSKESKCFVLSYKVCFLLYSVFSQPHSLAVSAGTLCLSCSWKTWGRWVLRGISKASTLDVRMSYIRAQSKARLSCNCIFPPWAKIHPNWTFVLTPLCRTCLPLSLCAQSSWCSFVMLNMLVCSSTFVQDSFIQILRNGKGFSVLKDFTCSETIDPAYKTEGAKT